MLRQSISLLITVLILSGCAGGLSGILGSSFPGHWLIYTVDFPAHRAISDRPTEDMLDEMLFKQGFELKYNWRSLFLANVNVATFRQKFRGNYIVIDVEISKEKIIMMSTSYSDNTKIVFNHLESALKEAFGLPYVTQRFCTKDINHYRC